MTAIGVYVDLSDAQLTRLRQAVPSSSVERVRQGAACDCAIVFGNPEPPAVAANRWLRWMQLESVGFGEYAGLDWSRDGHTAIVTNLAGFFAEPVAESILAGVLSLYRGIDRLIRLQAVGTWLGDPLRPELRTLQGARVVLFGHGAINRRLGELLAPFGCVITPIRRDQSADVLDRALADTDLVVCAAPATPATAGLFDAARLGRMRRQAIFCNFGRGSLVDEDALADALEHNRLAGAVIDVTQAEPLPQQHRFWSCPNMVLTQHSGGGTGDELDRKIDLFLANLARFQKGEALENVVDFSRGY